MQIFKTDMKFHEIHQLKIFKNSISSSEFHIMVDAMFKKFFWTVLREKAAFLFLVLINLILLKHVTLKLVEPEYWRFKTNFRQC